ncbi:hypothetical protein [Trichloromonas sp.]|uniref:hypothetical protein n=1 Tax=Trichloromonas sp. TaxID=3069249 RepID=UPI002A4DFEAC|nr:hypothetical protein [Trichloromonas sp.]
MEFYNNEKNDKLKFKINIEGIDINNIEPRLIITNENNNYLFFGNVTDNICTFNIPQLSNYNKGETGKIKFEIISEELYFPVWSDEFEIKTRANVKIEELYQEIEKPSKPKVMVDAILEKDKPLVEEKPKKVEEKVIPTVKHVNNIDDILEREKQKEIELVQQMKKLEEESKIEENVDNKPKNESRDNKKDTLTKTKQYKPIETISDNNKKIIRRFNDL